MNNKKVSIIVPIYNCAKYLCSCIESILSQSYANLELILVDDGSLDNSNDICIKYKVSDKRVKVFCQENSGASVARNLGIKNVSGEYLMFVDADDYIEKNMLQELVETAERKSADYVMCGMIVDTYNKQGNLISSLKSNQYQRTIIGNKNIPENIIDLVENESLSGPYCKLIKMNIINENLIKMPSEIYLQEDLYFNLRVLEHVHKICVLENCYYHYNKGIGGSVTSRYYQNKYDMTNEVHDLLFKFYEDRCADKEIIARIKYIYIKNSYAAFINLFHKDCKLAKKEKVKFIRDITNSPKYNFMVLTANRCGFKYKLIKFILMTKNSTLIYWISKVFYKMKYSYGLKY